MESISESIVKEDIPALYDIHKVELHMNSSHASKSTAAYLANKELEAGIKCILLMKYLRYHLILP